jgi:outer membrane protein OmpA-like peptidoglycan-associated protein
VTAKGYGPLAPVACSASPDGTRLNRRVEVWAGARDVRGPGR